MSQNPASWIIQDRVDMTDWVLHFVHDVNSSNEPTDEEIPFDRYGWRVYHEDPDINYRFSDWDVMDEDSGWPTDLSAYGVVRKIISDGHIRASWAFRNGKPSIYGPRAAVCVTEMPLHALVDYAKRRSATNVGCYAVGLLKSEFFAAGGRPAIYGLSTDWAEQDQGSQVWPRKLDASCGVAEGEQYRYVSMALASKRRIDWTHEREWRWADHQDRCWCPGLPVWVADEPHSFSQVLVVVRTDDEAAGILDLLKQMNDSGGNEFGVEFNLETLGRTSVISLEQLRQRLSDDTLRTVRLEDIPTQQLRQFESPPASQQDLDKLKTVLAEAKEAAGRAMRAEWNAAPKRPDGRVADVAGFASLKVHDAQTSLVSALLELGEASPLGGGGYFISDMTGGSSRLDQALRLEEEAARAAKRVFEQHYPEHIFSVYTRWD